jgi:hypothetical protein
MLRVEPINDMQHLLKFIHYPTLYATSIVTESHLSQNKLFYFLFNDNTPPTTSFGHAMHLHIQEGS